MKSREMKSGEGRHWVVELDELGDEMAVTEAGSRIEALDQVLAESSWTPMQIQNDEDTTEIEFRSDRGHLCVVAISPDLEKAKAAAKASWEAISGDVWWEDEI